MRSIRTVVLACMLDLVPVQGERLESPDSGEDSPLMQSVHTAGIVESDRPAHVPRMPRRFEIDLHGKTARGIKQDFEIGFNVIRAWLGEGPRLKLLTMDTQAHKQALRLLSTDACEAKTLAHRLNRLLLHLSERPTLLQVALQDHFREEVPLMQGRVSAWLEEHGPEAMAALQRLKTSTKRLLEMPGNARAQQALVATAVEAPALAQVFGWSPATPHEVLASDVLLLSQLTAEPEGWMEWGWNSMGLGPAEAKAEAEVTNVEEAAAEGAMMVEQRVAEELTAVEDREEAAVAEAREEAAAGLKDARASAEAKLELAKAVLEEEAALKEGAVESEVFATAERSVEQLNETLRADLRQLEAEGAAQVARVKGLASAELAVAEEAAEEELAVADEQLEKAELERAEGPEELKDLAVQEVELAKMQGAEIAEVIEAKVSEVAAEAGEEATALRNASLPIMAEKAQAGAEALEDWARAEVGDGVWFYSQAAAQQMSQMTRHLVGMAGEAITAHSKSLQAKLVNISREELHGLMVVGGEYKAELSPIVMEDLRRLQEHGMGGVLELSERSQLILLKYLEILRKERARLTPVVMKELEEIRTAPKEKLHEALLNISALLAEILLELRKLLGMRHEDADGALGEEEAQVLASLLSTKTKHVQIIFTSAMPWGSTSKEDNVALTEFLADEQVSEGRRIKLDTWRHKSLVQLMTDRDTETDSEEEESMSTEDGERVLELLSEVLTGQDSVDDAEKLLALMAKGTKTKSTDDEKLQPFKEALQQWRLYSATRAVDADKT